ncbi:hypothetical protein ACIQXW_07465 [Lysinibacillus sp. NPDC097162]|uniref:hypothetical protein n=1 Tax=Lysinibacillus sp. NPDC097162 TaxID=3364140 RepID=UPI0038260EBB
MLKEFDSIRILFLFSLAIILVGCTTSPSTNPQPSHPTNTDEQNDKEQATNQPFSSVLASYFPQDGTTAYFQGEGNEFASYTLQTTYIDETSIAQVENNGGVTLLKVYRITKSAIELVYMEAADETPTLPTAHDIATFPVIEIILQQPLEVGSHFNGWEILSTTASIPTGLTTFHDVIELIKTKDNMTTSKYFAKGVGLIRTKDEMVTNNGESFIITSTLQKIE